MIHQFSGNFHDGTFGRISIHQEIFPPPGGYDEQFAPMGFQDIDLLARLAAMGVKYIPVRNRNFSKAIVNTKVESVALCNSKMTYQEMNALNYKSSLEETEEVARFNTQ